MSKQGILGPVRARYCGLRHDDVQRPITLADVIDERYKVIAGPVDMDIAEYIAHCINSYERIVEVYEELRETEIIVDEAWDEIASVIYNLKMDQPK